MKLPPGVEGHELDALDIDTHCRIIVLETTLRACLEMTTDPVMRVNIRSALEWEPSKASRAQRTVAGERSETI